MVDKHIMLLKTLPSVFAFALLWAFVTAEGEDQASYGHTQGYFKKIEKGKFMLDLFATELEKYLILSIYIYL